MCSKGKTESPDELTCNQKSLNHYPRWPQAIMLVTRRVSEEASEWCSISSATVAPAFRTIVFTYDV